MKKFFKYFISIGIIILLLIVTPLIWWNMNSRSEKSDFFANAHQYEKTIEFDQNDSQIWMERSIAYNKAGDFEKGFKYLNKAVEIDPLLHLGYRGWIRLRKLRDYDKALIDFDNVDSLTTNFVDAPWGEDIDFLRGECYFGKMDYTKAIEMFNRSIKNQKEGWADLQTFVYLGLCEYHLGNYEKAIAEFKKGLNQHENLCEAHFGMAKAYKKLGQMDKAMESILKAEETIAYKRDDVYNEFLNEIYISEILEFKQQLHK